MLSTKAGALLSTQLIHNKNSFMVTNLTKCVNQHCCGLEILKKKSICLIFIQLCKIEKKIKSFSFNKAVTLLEFCTVLCRVSNGTGQCNFSGQRDRSSFIVPGQRDNGTSSKSCQGTGRAGTAKTWDGTGRDSQNPGRDAGQNGTEQKRMF